jgi:hypothetical protein
LLNTAVLETGDYQELPAQLVRLVTQSEVVGVFTTGPRGESNLENTKVVAMEWRGKIE